MKNYKYLGHFPAQWRLIDRNMEDMFSVRTEKEGNNMDNLIGRAKLRDADAFTQLMQSHMQTMYKTARAILYNEEDAADAISETILTCWEKIGQLKQESYFKTWMTRILINKCNDLIRKQENLLLTEEIPDIPAREKGYENMEWNEALNMLDEKYRLAIILYYVDGFRTSEISEILSITDSAVRSRLARGREQLAQGYYTEMRRKQV